MSILRHLLPIHQVDHVLLFVQGANENEDVTDTLDIDYSNVAKITVTAHASDPARLKTADVQLKSLPTCLDVDMKGLRDRCDTGLHLWLMCLTAAGHDISAA